MATYRELLDELARRCGRYGIQGESDFENNARTALREAMDRAALRHPFPWWTTEAAFSPKPGTQALSLPPDCVLVRYLFTPSHKRMRQRDYERVMDFGVDHLPGNTYTIKPTEPFPFPAEGSCLWDRGSEIVLGDNTAWKSELENRVFSFRDDPEWAWIEEVLSTTEMRLSRHRRAASMAGESYRIDSIGHQALWFLMPLREMGAYRLVYSRRPRIPDDWPDDDKPDLPEQYHYHYLLWSAYATLLELTKANLGSLDRARSMAETYFLEMVTASRHLLAEKSFRISSRAM